MSVIQKASAGRVADSYDFVLSTQDVDRHGDIVVQDGLSIKQFEQNPIALFQHDHSAPVGVWSNLRRKGKALLGTFTPVAPGTSKVADLAVALLEQGVLRAVSVSFIGTKKEYMEPRGVRYLASELLEVSLVTVPANPNALRIAKSLGMSEDELNKFVITPPVGDIGDDAPPKGQSADRTAVNKKALDAIYRAKKTIRSVRS
jgi:HK97 family phage prohead protease